MSGFFISLQDRSRVSQTYQLEKIVVWGFFLGGGLLNCQRLACVCVWGGCTVSVYPVDAEFTNIGQSGGGVVLGGRVRARKRGGRNDPARKSRVIDAEEEK